MSDLDQREDNLDTVYSILQDCGTSDIPIWDLLPIIHLALKTTYPDVKVRFIVETL